MANLATRTRLHKLVTAVVELCDALVATVVADGLETTDELHAVIDTGAACSQEFLIARPANPAPMVDRKKMGHPLK